MFRLIVLGGANAKNSADFCKELATQRCSLGNCRMKSEDNKERIAIISTKLFWYEQPDPFRVESEVDLRLVDSRWGRVSVDIGHIMIYRRKVFSRGMIREKSSTLAFRVKRGGVWEPPGVHADLRQICCTACVLALTLSLSAAIAD